MSLLKPSTTKSSLQQTKATIVCKSLQILVASICLVNHGLYTSHLNIFYFNLISGTFGATIILQSFYLMSRVSLQPDHTTIAMRNVVLIGAYLWISGILFDNINQESYNNSFWVTMMNPVLSLVILMIMVIELAVNFSQTCQ